MDKSEFDQIKAEINKLNIRLENKKTFLYNTLVDLINKRGVVNVAKIVGINKGYISKTKNKKMIKLISIEQLLKFIEKLMEKEDS